MSENKQFCTFSLQGQTFGIEVLEIQEVIRYQEMTAVPLAPPMVRGLINLRGQIVTAIDLRSRFDMAPLPPGHMPMNVVVRTEDGAVSLLVDEIGDVVEISSDIFEATPETLQGVARDLVNGVYKMKDRLLLVLDTKRTVNLAGIAGIERATQTQAA